MGATWIGIRYRGEVDRAGRLFHVRTRCLVVLNFPVVPLGCYVILPRAKGPDLAVPIPFSLKSWIVAWAHALCGIMTFVSIVWFCVEVNHGIKPAMRREAVLPAMTCVASVTLLIASVTVTGIAKATPRRAAELGRLIGLPEEEIDKALGRSKPAGFEVVLPGRR